ncbi:MAG: ABC transporter ATP-binding protein [Candidatus Latescibacterota bacterium]|nr:MAG: ABC transporter ATP-binding protein [Candidatus Latescibacterota bacterium]
MDEPLLSIRDLCVDYVSEAGCVRAVDHVTLDVSRAEIVGVAGESGSGKSTLAQALLRILPPPAIISGGEARFEGRDILTLSETELRELRWRRISMVFQSAMDSLNPVISIGEQIVDTLVAHGAATRQEARSRAAELLEMVGIPAPRVDAYAHQLSGGMRQRVGIALALALEPALVILDEPTTALDVIVEREILQQIRGLQEKLGFAVLFITHDLARMLQFSDRVAVFYAAQLVELAPAAELRRAPRHPYTEGLLRAFPSVQSDADEPESIPGAPPSLLSPPAACRFHPRCDRVQAICRERQPDLIQLGPRRAAACHLAE